jgi:hypothetical protein
VTVTVRESADGLVITDGAAAWTVEGPELRDAIERLAG